MAYSSNEVQTLVDSIKINEHSELRVYHVSEDGNFKAIDIRTWYNTQKDPEMKPTQKGVRIYEANVGQFLKAVNSCLN